VSKSEKPPRRHEVIDSVCVILAEQLDFPLEKIFPDTNLMKQMKADQGDLLEICFRIEQRFGLKNIVQECHFNTMSRRELESIVAGQLVDFVCQQIGAVSLRNPPH